VIIAIDGPAASGKGTLARRLAEHFGLAHLDTGLLYRAVAARLLRAGGDPSDAKAAAEAARGLALEDLADPGLRGDGLSGASSQVAAVPAVREALFELQRRFASTPPGGKSGAVLDGRDIGTVICPEADAKLFVTADLETRAKRRHKELQARGIDIIYARVLQDLKERDARDMGRRTAPLKRAEDAFPLDTSGLDEDQAFKAAVDYILKTTGGDRP
jgi:cytidylate kinase